MTENLFDWQNLYRKSHMDVAGMESENNSEILWVNCLRYGRD